MIRSQKQCRCWHDVVAMPMKFWKMVAVDDRSNVGSHMVSAMQDNWV